MLHRDGTRWTTDRPLYPAELAPAFAALKPLSPRAGLTPCQRRAQTRGAEIPGLLTASQQGEMMLRFVLRSEVKVASAARRAAVATGTLPQLEA